MEDEEIDLREYINVLIKRKWIVIVFFLIAIITTIVINYFVLPPIYRSTVNLQISSDVKVKLDKLDNEKYETSINIPDILFILNSDSLLKKAAKKINLDYGIEKIKRQVKVENIEDSNIITLSVEDEDPKVAKDLANIITNIFIEENQSIYEEKRKLMEDALKTYQDQLSEVEKDISEMEKTKQKILASSELSEMEKNTQISLLMNVVATERSNRNYLIGKIASLKEELLKYEGFKIIDPASQPIAPIKPNKKLNITIGGVLGLFLGVFIAFFMEFWERK
ncbi:MAG: hypothetical protein Kow00103_07870 [Candidatus Caldatribacteriota bacterium]